MERAIAENIDVLMIDTAGRLQNKDNLMAELEKIGRIIKRVVPDAPHETLLALDASTGQNALVDAYKRQAQGNGDQTQPNPGEFGPSRGHPL